MSNSLVKKSLELLTFENDVVNDKSKKRKSTSAGILDLIPTKHRLISKDNKKVILKRSSTLTVADAKKKLETKSNRMEENIRKLLRLSNCKYDEEVMKKVIDRGVKKRYLTEEDKPVEEEKTVFTEEDFQKFEAEYFG
ncbi:PREDICTED: active regulator of SIRT1-like [Ceratosolen solmsi marchali]|uniref:Active regulator of SIRT1 n=1 Tax=Ceratosolen solmsi marchali TaxID=326594 RepID=A0AAJ6YJ33_9HYME|nr:PREDICTED: active regulator of SIRT1-like [Ceratosolen solmsi marchali]